MPLKPGSDNATVSGNIRELYDANKTKAKPRPKKQIVAIALAEKARSIAKGLGKR